MAGQGLPSLFGVDAPVMLKMEKMAGFPLVCVALAVFFCQPGEGGAN
jgi:hypothetical protein